MKNCLLKFVYQSTIVFLPISEIAICSTVMKKDLLMPCITYYSGLAILLIQSSTSQICVFVDP